MSEALTTFAAAFAPRPITYRTIDFRTNEFRGLEGGDRFEPEEANPMIGYRGRAALHARARPARAWSSTRSTASGTQGHTNFHVMIPFVRTPRELEAALPGGRRRRPARPAAASSSG